MHSTSMEIHPSYNNQRPTTSVLLPFPLRHRTTCSYITNTTSNTILLTQILRSRCTSRSHDQTRQTSSLEIYKFLLSASQSPLKSKHNTIPESKNGPVTLFDRTSGIRFIFGTDYITSKAPELEQKLLLKLIEEVPKV